MEGQSKETERSIEVMPHIYMTLDYKNSTTPNKTTTTNNIFHSVEKATPETHIQSSWYPLPRAIQTHLLLSLQPLPKRGVGVPREKGSSSAAAAKSNCSPSPAGGGPAGLGNSIYRGKCSSATDVMPG
jgi:hypothetical protein